MSNTPQYPTVSVGDVVMFRHRRKDDRAFPLIVQEVGVNSIIGGVVVAGSSLLPYSGIHHHSDPWTFRPELLVEVPTWELAGTRKRLDATIDALTAELAKLRAGGAQQEEAVEESSGEDSPEDVARRLIASGMRDIPRLRTATGLLTKDLKVLLAESPEMAAA